MKIYIFIGFFYLNPAPIPFICVRAPVSRSLPIDMYQFIWYSTIKLYSLLYRRAVQLNCTLYSLGGQYN